MKAMRINHDRRKDMQEEGLCVVITIAVIVSLKMSLVACRLHVVAGFVCWVEAGRSAV